MSKSFLFVLVLVPLAGILAFLFRQDDRLFWPSSAHTRIESMASILRELEGPAGWCYPSSNELNLLNQNGNWQIQLSQCMSRIVPVSGFEEIHERQYIRQFYRASVNDKFCEVTLSTVWKDERVVGADCYYGLFDQLDDTGVGLTSDPFG